MKKKGIVLTPAAILRTQNFNPIPTPKAAPAPNSVRQINYLTIEVVLHKRYFAFR